MYAENVGDDTHMTSIKIVQFSRPPATLPVHLRPKLFHPLDRGRLISNELPPPPPPPPPSSLNDNQSIKGKHDPRMTIICCQQSNYRIIHHLQ